MVKYINYCKPTDTKVLQVHQTQDQTSFLCTSSDQVLTLENCNKFMVTATAEAKIKIYREPRQCGSFATAFDTENLSHSILPWTLLDADF